MASKTWKVSCAAGVAIATLASAGCGESSTDGSSSSGGGDEGGAKKSVYLVSSVGTGWQEGFNNAFVKSLEDKGVDVTLLQDPFDAQQNVQNINQAVAKRPDAVAFMSIDDQAVLPAVQEAKQQDVPIFNLNGAPDKRAAEFLTASLESNNEQQGRLAAENIVEGLKAIGLKTANVVAITGTAATNTVKDRMRGFNAVLSKTPEYKLVAEEDGLWDQTKTAQIAQTLFAKFKSKGGIQAAYGMADNQAAGIIQAAKQANVPLGVERKGLIVTGSNCYKIGIDAIKSGAQYGTATQAPGPEATWAAGWVEKFLNGEKLDSRLLLDQERITKENVAEYAEECNI